MASADELTAIFREATEALVVHLRQLVSNKWPEAMVQANVTNRPGQHGTTLSVLHRQDGDGIELQLELSSIDDVTWVEATLFLGQSTLVTLSSQCWSPASSRPEELRRTIEDFATFLQPRFLQLVRLQA